MKYLLTYILIYSAAFAQFLDFGRNKVIYNEFDWYILPTPHFKIYYYKEAEELAKIGAHFLEEGYNKLQQKLNHSFSDTNPIIFYASPLHFKQTNITPGFIPEGVGGFFEFIKNRVVLPFDGSLHQFRHVSRHELVHVFTVSKAIATLRSHGYISDRLPPLWFVEGLAEYWSTEWDTEAEMVLKDAVINNRLPGISDYESIYGTYLMYKLGQKACEYIAEKYGEESLCRLIENFWMDENFSNIMKTTIGKNYEEFDEEFLLYLKKRYYSQIHLLENTTKQSRIVHDEFFSHKPSYHSKNNLDEIYFIGNNTGYTSIYKIDINSFRKSADLVIRGEKEEDYESFHYFRTGIDISNNGILAFITQKGESDVLNLYDLNRSKKLVDYSFDKLVKIGAPSFSADGKKIVFSANDISGRTDLFILDLDKEKLTRLTDDFYDDIDADFSPDGNLIIFSSDRGNETLNSSYNLFLYDLKHKRITQLTKTIKLKNTNPKFSDDGKEIIFESDSGGINNIWLLTFLNDNLEKFELQQITNFMTGCFDPVWCGKNRIAFSYYYNGTFSIRVIDNIRKNLSNEQNIFAKEPNNEITGYPLEEYKYKSEIEDIYTGKLKYKKEFSLDIAVTGITADPIFGTATGGIISLSDMLGDEKYNFLILNTSNTESDFWKSFNIAVSKISLAQRLNYAFGIYHLNGKRYDLQSSDYAYYERQFGGYVSFSYPLSFFRRIDATVSISQSHKDIDIFDVRRGMLLTNSLSYVFDNSLWSYTGPVDGERYNVSLGYTTDLTGTTENFFTLMLDYRKYFRISKPITLALRSQFFINEGKNPRRFFIGGSWSLRGWPFISIRGTKMLQANAELRFPVINIMKMYFPEDISLSFYGIRGALFFDVGNCWDTSKEFENIKGSLGAGLRMNLFGFLVLRYDLGKRIEEKFKKFQDGLFHQFFIGWDF
ncbi:MAG: BamA/TamA family outer membrane protein [Ignavibacteria bacterium]|nr:BamA/TamA family outer membrane protein [Ignavibacteria bacterium]